MPDDHLVTKAEMCAMMQISRRTLEKYMAAGQIPFVRIGKRFVRFDLQTVRQHLLGQTKQTKPETK